MSCQDEYIHNHDHGHDENDHVPPPDTNQIQTLYPYIDLSNVTARNATKPEHAARIVRPWEERLLDDPILTSDVDEELLIVIPFTGMVKLHSILIRSLGDESAPEDIVLFKDQPQLDFDKAASLPPVQKLTNPAGVSAGVSTNETREGIVQFAVNRPKFTNVQSLTIYIPSNYGGEQTKLLYIGLRGEFSEPKRAPVIAQYEAAANPADHKTKATSLDKNSNQLG